MPKTPAKPAKRGRPPKPAGTVAVRKTVAITPAEIAGLEARYGTVYAGLRAGVALALANAK